MNIDSIEKLLQQVKEGDVQVEDALKELKKLPFEDIEYAKIDHHRTLRKGFPEVIYCEGKTVEQVGGIAQKLLAHEHANLLATRASKDVYTALKNIDNDAQYFERARIVLIEKEKIKQNEGIILVITAGTSDIPVADEAAVTAAAMGNKVERLYDVGVAGIHRLLAHTELIMKAKVVIVVAGMEGALPSVVGGLVDKPIIAVPTSVGYGASFNGLAALLTMLNSCSSGIGVVNIDNGFGAGYLASLINKC